MYLVAHEKTVKSNPLFCLQKGPKENKIAKDGPNIFFENAEVPRFLTGFSMIVNIVEFSVYSRVLFPKAIINYV